MEYGQIMESVKMKVSDRKKRGKTGNVQFETLSRNQMAIGCEREWYGKGFVRAVPKRESSSLADLRNSVFVHAHTTGRREKDAKENREVSVEWSEYRASRECTSVGAWWQPPWWQGQARRGSSSDQNEAGRHLHRGGNAATFAGADETGHRAEMRKRGGSGPKLS